MLVYFYVVLAGLLRLVPHPWNITPIGSMFLFSGAIFRRKWESLLVPLAALLITDLAVIRFVYRDQYHWFSPWTWLGFLLVGLIGWTLRGRTTRARVGLASVSGSVAFFLVTNLGVWLEWKMYPATLSGLLECYAAAIPFFRNTLLGDLTYAAAMFGSYHLLMHRRTQTTTQS